jgi:hypothetical protein
VLSIVLAVDVIVVAAVDAADANVLSIVLAVDVIVVAAVDAAVATVDTAVLVAEDSELPTIAIDFCCFN